MTFFFFWQPVAGLTNRVPVRNSRAGAPLQLLFHILHLGNVGHTCNDLKREFLEFQLEERNGPAIEVFRVNYVNY